jgi:hypothetical protein
MAGQEIHLKRLAREQRLLRYSRFRVAYDQAARRRGLGAQDIGRRQFERWLEGRLKTLPRPLACDILEEMFGEEAEHLFSPVPADADPDAQGAEPPAPSRVVEDLAVEGVPVAAPHGSSGLPPHGPKDLEREAVMAAAHASSEHAATVEAAFLGPSMMEQLEAEVIRLARGYLGRSPIALFGETTAARDRIYTKLGQTRRPDQLKELYLLAGVLCGLLSELSLDLGYPEAAAEHALAAWAYGNMIGHNGLCVWARGMQSAIAFWSKRPRDAVAAVRRGQEHAPAGIPAVRLHGIQARAWSHLGNIEQTVQAVHAAEDARADSHGGDPLHEGIGGVFAWGEDRQELCAGSAYLQLAYMMSGNRNQPELDKILARVIHHIERALGLFQQAVPVRRSSTIESSARVDLAAAHLLQGDLEKTQDTLTSILDLPADRRTQRVLTRLDHLRGQLADPHLTRSSRARQLNEQILDFTATATVRALPPSR